MTSAINKDNRVSEQSLVGATPPVLPAGHPDLYFFNPKNVIVVDKGAVVYEKYLKGGSPSSEVSSGNAPDEKFATPAPAPAPGEVDADVFELTSIIGEPTPIPKYDPVTGALTYWMVLKIKNTSKNPDVVKGVDARIYIPGS
jgi:hypothetical protein